MKGFFRAYLWLRWRVLVNSLEQRGRRDALERFSRAVQYLGPVLTVVFLLPAALAVGAAGVVAGAAAPGSDHGPVATAILRTALLAAVVLSVFGPLILPAGRFSSASGATRLLLLPVSRRALYTGEAAAGLADPWIVLILPALLLVPAGALWAGQPGTAALALAAGALVLNILIGLGALVSFATHMVLRHRGRGELLALMAMLLLPALVLLHGRGERRVPPPAPVVQEDAAGEVVPREPERRVPLLALLPSEAYVRTAIRTAPAVVSPWMSLGWLTLLGVALHGLASLVFRRVLDTPSTGRPRSARALGVSWGWRVPGLSPGAWPVALALFALARRTPRGRMVLFGPILATVVLVVVAPDWMRGVLVEQGISPALALAAVAGLVSMISLSPILANQFAIDRAGLILQWLAPLTPREVLAGKAAGGALIAAVPVTAGTLLGLALFPPGPAGLWVALGFGLTAVYLLLAPLSAMLSALFPKPARLDSMGSGGNPHAAANFLALPALFGAAVPPGALIAVALFRDSPALAALLAAGWCALAAGLSAALFRAAAWTLAARQENLGMVAMGK